MLIDKNVFFDKNKCPYFETKCNDLSCPCAKYKAYLDVQNPQIVQQELAQLGITSDMNLFEKILNIQKHFAARFHIVYNLNKETTDYWCKEYSICMEDEIEELFDYIKLDDNKEIKTDIKELKKEIADITHFVLDEMIAGECPAQVILDNYKNKYLHKEYENDPFIDIFNFSIKQIEKIFFIKRNDEYANVKQMWNYAGNINKWNNILMTLALRLLFMNREIRQQISWKHWKKPYTEINYDKLYLVYTDLLYYFMLLAAFIFDSAEEIANTYINKNIENIRRQKYNY